MKNIIFPLKHYRSTYQDTDHRKQEDQHHGSTHDHRDPPVRYHEVTARDRKFGGRLG